MAGVFVKKQKAARRELQTLMNESHTALLIHYASDGIVAARGIGSPRVAAVVVRNLKSGQTRSFSAHLIAEELKRPIEDLWAEDGDIERNLLEAFFNHARNHEEARWVHWNMRDSSFGFDALEHRFRVLARNNLDRHTFLTGAEEADHLTRREVAKVHQSTLRKVSVFEHFLELAHDGRLKTDASWWDLHGGSVRAAFDWLASHPWIQFALALLGSALAIITAWPR